MLAEIEKGVALVDMLEARRFCSLETLNRLAPRVTYGFSPASFGSMSVSYGGESSVANRASYARAMGIDVKSLVKINTEYSNKVLFVRREDMGAKPFPADGLITTQNGVTLALLPADCSPIIISSKKTEFVAMVHAGRQGTDGQICAVAVQKLQYLGFDPAEMVVGIGPAVGCYEMRYLKTQSPRLWLEHLSVVGGGSLEVDVQSNGSGEYTIKHVQGYPLWVDLVGCNVEQLVKAGIPRGSISLSGVCTRCYAEKGLSFSHSLSSEDSRYVEGRFMAFVQLR